MKQILVCTPSRNGHYTDGYMKGLWQMARRKSSFEYIPSSLVGVSNVFAARDQLSNIFVNHTKADVLLWIDADTGFDETHLKAMEESILSGRLAGCCLQSKIENPKTYAEKAIENGSFHTGYIARFTGGGFYRKRGKKIDGLLHSGFGFFWVHRKAYERLSSSSEIHLNPCKYELAKGEAKEGFSYHFPILTPEGEILSEDLSFCKRLQVANIQIHLPFVDGVTHQGFVTMPGIESRFLI